MRSTKDAAQVSLAEDQRPVGDLGSDSQYEASGEAVRTRTPGRDLDHLDARISQHRVEGRRELPSPIADEEPEPGGMFGGRAGERALVSHGHSA
jgi:hypothetical protein